MNRTLLPRAAPRGAAALCCCLLAWAAPATAFTEATSKKAPGGENTPLNLTSSAGSTSTSSGGSSLVRTIVGLAIVIAVIWGLSWILRQVKSGRGGTRVSSAGLASVAALTLGSGRTLHLVRAGNDFLLLGSGERGVVPIHRYTEAQALEAGLLSGEQSLEHERRRLLGVPHDSDRPPVANAQPLDPMRPPSLSAGVVERLRELTVRR